MIFSEQLTMIQKRKLWEDSTNNPFKVRWNPYVHVSLACCAWLNPWNNSDNSVVKYNRSTDVSCIGNESIEKGLKVDLVQT